ncbi:uncharacterized protein C8Q71DRAFT_846960 [Rhodofomes roseus]|uniref:Uncharacterized protein n=1 Tax=Rhodofomes roseus TaxID=34475 RepID=A0ABQ8KNR6_9APHY|nr:uncharacterized protein C8Q71DRAFT_846960 [Rhodofomes roseus]KAH9839392.1 hypothetical protein C8Q71DRAFT_846960 [Rhodofomes roseus]
MLSLLRSRSSAAKQNEAAAKPPADKQEATSTPTTPQVDTAQSLDAATSPAPPTDSTTALAPPSDGASSSAPGSTAGSAGHQPPAAAKSPPRAARRLSWRPFAKTSGSNGDARPATQQNEKTKVDKPAAPAARPLVRTRSEKQAQESALLVRELIVGPSSKAPTKAKSKAHSSAEIEKVKAQLARPKTASKVIAQLRQLSSSDEPVVVGKGLNGETLTALPKGPIHAVCLPCTDAEAHDRHFSRLTADKTTASEGAQGTEDGKTTTTTRSVSVHVHATSSEAEVCSVANASITTLNTVFSEVNLVSLITTPDLGLGGPPDGPGILSGALPSAQTIIKGVEQITPQLMALGYATGKSVLPDHAGIYPPTDRMSVITYWWGFEVAMPPPSLHYLDNVPSVAHAVVNFLTALSVAEGGVREIMPFVRYISQFIDTEFNMIKRENEGKGVVCAATWIMPVALVPRPWDFPQPPPKSVDSASEPPTGGADAADAPAVAPELGPTSVPIMVTPNGASSTANPPEAAQNLPEVKVTPPTPPASQTLKSSTETEHPAVALAAAPVVEAAAS